MTHFQQTRRLSTEDGPYPEEGGSRQVKRRKSTACSPTYLPLKFIKCDKDNLITVISRMLASIVHTNDQRTNINISALDESTLTRFHSRSPPQISIFDYLSRLAKYSMLNPSVLISSVYYIDLLSTNYSAFALNSLTVHRFLLTATTVASKALCDSFCSNSHYAKVGGVNIIELNMLEVEFLTRVQYRVVPRDFNYDNYRERKNSTGALEDTDLKDWRFGICSAAKILDLYYSRMVDMMGGAPSKSNEIGHKDDLTFEIQMLDSEDEGTS